MGGTGRVGEASAFPAEGEIDNQINAYIQSIPYELMGMQEKTAHVYLTVSMWCSENMKLIWQNCLY